MRCRWAIAGVLLAIAVTTTMDATGLSQFSALPLLPIAAILWFLQRLRQPDVGLAWGTPRGYALAILHPLIVIGVLTILAIAFRRAHLAEVHWRRIAIAILVNSIAGWLTVLLTEELFFRGWLWGALKRADLSENRTLLWSSIAFGAWHISAVTLDTGFNPPPAQIPVLLVNAFVLGIIWGLLRSISGSILVSSLCHSVWNAGAYRLFGFGTKVGGLGIMDTTIFGPEVGLLGLILNGLFAAVLYTQRRTKKSSVMPPIEAPAR